VPDHGCIGFGGVLVRATVRTDIGFAERLQREDNAATDAVRNWDYCGRLGSREYCACLGPAIVEALIPDVQPNALIPIN